MKEVTGGWVLEGWVLTLDLCFPDVIGGAVESAGQEMKP